MKMGAAAEARTRLRAAVGEAHTLTHTRTHTHIHTEKTLEEKGGQSRGRRAASREELS